MTVSSLHVLISVKGKASASASPSRQAFSQVCPAQHFRVKEKYLLRLTFHTLIELFCSICESCIRQIMHIHDILDFIFTA